MSCVAGAMRRRAHSTSSVNKPLSTVLLKSSTVNQCDRQRRLTAVNVLKNLALLDFEMHDGVGENATLVTARVVKIAL